ncbi:DUF924 domain-containing protein [Altererythrobacter sp. SALINAS58]|uniref:DUF924 family protein n=1 Tax=Alteripontixanthobacter muriae TaxID=2705546 RepID=UPI0015753E48|nr:DUF924 family protein [Alteripontixanthobacter muriae]NTZ43917.1 DUF924 domain-containing protein [Alteripontixanthobacter muriae]
MTMVSRRWAAEVLHVWFHRLGPADWFNPAPDVDTTLCHRFQDELHALGRQRVGAFLTGPDLALASVLLFDQVPRNIFRGSAKAYDWDSLAQNIARGAIQRGWDNAMTRHQRQFLGMPLMHSEDIADQQASLRYFSQPELRFVGDFALSHYRMIARFGRFPHRNPVLGRASTEAERKAVASGFSW